MPYFPGTLLVRGPDLRSIVDEVDWSHALSLAVSGTVEGVATSSGRLRYFRMLGPDEIPERRLLLPSADPADSADTGAGGGGAGTRGVLANTRLGAYREPVTSLRATGALDASGQPSFDAETIGWIWQLYMAKLGS